MGNAFFTKFITNLFDCLTWCSYNFKLFQLAHHFFYRLLWLFCWLHRCNCTKFNWHPVSWWPLLEDFLARFCLSFFLPYI